MQKIGFSTSNGLISRLIRKITGGETSHCFIVFTMEGSHYDPTLVFESGNKGPAFVDFGEFIKSNRIIDLFDSKVDLIDPIEKYSKQLSKDYDFAGLVGGVVVQIGRALGKTWRNPFNTKNLTCVELTLGILVDAKYPGIEQFSDYAVVTPQDLLDFFRKGE